MGEGGRRPGEGRAADVEVFHQREADDGGGIDGVFAVGDGGDVEDGIRLGQRVIAGVSLNGPSSRSGSVGSR